MPLFAQVSGGSLSGRSTAPPIILNGGIVDLPIALSSNISTVTPSEPPIGATPEFILNGSIVTLPITLSSDISNVVI